jgi:hypothetical protein
VQKRARDLEASHLPPREVPHLVACPVCEADLGKPLLRHGPGRAPADAMQGGMIEQVLAQAEIEVEGARLEHDAELRQGRGALAAHVEAQDPDRSGGAVMKPGDQREQGRLAGSIETKESREGTGRNLKIDAIEGLARPEGVAHVANAERGRRRWFRPPYPIRPRTRAPAFHHCGATATPHG